MTIYDAAMAGLLVAGMVWGAWRGITWQLASIASLVLGFSVSHPLSAQLAPRFPGEPVVARALAMLAIYVAVSGSVFLVAWIVRATLRQLKFEAFDRHLGMIIGGLEAALLGMIATLFVVSLAPQTRTPIFASFSGRIVGQAMNLVGPVLPGELRDALAPYWSGNEPGDRSTVGNEIFRPAPLDRPSGPGRTADGGASGRQTGPKFQDLLEEGESRLGRVIVEAAEKGLQSTGDGNGREVKRR